MPVRPTGYVRTIERQEGPVLYAKLKLPDGSQPQRRLGRLWTKRSKPPEGFVTERQAQARLEAMLAGEDPTVNIAPSRATFRMACDERLRFLRDDKQRKKSTLADYENVIDADLIPFFGAETRVEEIDTAAVEALRDRLLERVSHRTAQKVMVILHGVFARAKRKGWITLNPCEDAEKVTLVGSDEFNVLEPDEVMALARAAADPMMGDLFVVGAFTGLRCPGELIALRWENIDFTNRIVRVSRNFTRGEETTTKGKRTRSLPLSDQAITALDRLSRRGDFTGPTDMVFCTEVGGRISGDVIRDAFYAALAKAGLNHLRYLRPPTADDPDGELRDDSIIPYDLRHTFGTLAVRTSPLSDVQAWMGHQDIATTMKYVHYVPQHDAAARLTAAFSGPRPSPLSEPAHEPLGAHSVHGAEIGHRENA
jgi:integrase